MEFIQGFFYLFQLYIKISRDENLRVLSSFFTLKNCGGSDSLVLVIWINPSAPSLFPVLK